MKTGINVLAHDIEHYDCPDVPCIKLEDFQKIKSWGLDTVQFQIPWGRLEPTIGAYDMVFWNKLASVIPLAGQAGLHYTFQFTLRQSSWVSYNNFWTDTSLQERFYALWGNIVQLTPNAVGYSILSEPKPLDTPAETWTPSDKARLDDMWMKNGKVLDEAIRRIRQLCNTQIIVEPGPWAEPIGAWGNWRARGLAARPFNNIIYCAHMYVPHEMTHGCIEWTGTKEELMAALLPFLDFGRTFGVPLRIGETGIMTKNCTLSESRLRWVDENLKNLNSLGLPWIYHEYSHQPRSFLSPFCVLDSNGNERSVVGVIKANIPGAPSVLSILSSPMSGVPFTLERVA